MLLAVRLRPRPPCALRVSGRVPTISFPQVGTAPLPRREGSVGFTFFGSAFGCCGLSVAPLPFLVSFFALPSCFASFSCFASLSPSSFSFSSTGGFAKRSIHSAIRSVCANPIGARPVRSSTSVEPRVPVLCALTNSFSTAFTMSRSVVPHARFTLRTPVRKSLPPPQTE